MDELCDRALYATVYNAVALECETLSDALDRLVNGFAVVLFGQRALAFEDKTDEKRSPSPPEAENTVKGAKDALTETLRTNTGLLRRHLRTPALRLYETKLGRRSGTGVALVWLDGLTDPALVQRMKRRLSEPDIDGLVMPASVEEYLTGSRRTAFLCSSTPSAPIGSPGRCSTGASRSWSTACRWPILRRSIWRFS